MVIGLGENKLVQTWMLLPCWLAFMASYVAREGAETEESSTILAALTVRYSNDGPEKTAYGHNSDTNVVGIAN